MTSQFQSALKNPHVLKARNGFRGFVYSLIHSLDRRLFEASLDFWSYHITGLALVFLLDVVVNFIFTPSYIWGFQILAGSIWVVGFFFAGLLLRRRYIDANWDQQPQGQVLLKTIASCIFFALIVVSTMSLVAMPFYFDDLYQYRQSDVANISALRVICEFIFKNWFATSFYLFCWMILYTGITARRRTKQVEVVNLRLQNSLKEAELSSLSNQLNPHFLFNALNNIRFMIHEDANNAESMLMSLSSVLRYSLESSKREIVPLEQELEVSNRYIDLIQIQFEERLDFQLQIPEQLLSCTLPPMVLQMLLENAVKHGIENIKSGGKIEVIASLDDQMMTLEVRNDLPSDYEREQKEPGIGLLNIDQRLDLLYAGRGSIETKVEDGRFCVSVHIPQD